MQSSEQETRSTPIIAYTLGLLCLAILYLGLPWLITTVIVWFSGDRFTFGYLFPIVGIVNFLLFQVAIGVMDRNDEKRLEAEARELEVIATWVCPHCGQQIGEPMLRLPIEQPSKRERKRWLEEGDENAAILSKWHAALVCAHCETLNCYDADGKPQVDSVPWDEAEMLNAMADEANSRD